MTKLYAVLALTLLVLLAATSATAGTTFAQTTQTSNATQFTILQNSTGTVTITGTGQDNFTYLVGGTPFGGAPVLANFLLTATTAQTGACGSSPTCATGDNFAEQGFTGTFSYIAAGGLYNGDVLLSGTFNVNATPTNSGGKLSDIINGNGGAYAATATPTNLNGIQMASFFLNFAGETNETGGWQFSGLTPVFAVDPTTTFITLPTNGTSFTAAAAATFSGDQVPSVIPEPATLSLIGGTLLGLGLLRRKRVSRQ